MCSMGTCIHMCSEKELPFSRETCSVGGLKWRCNEMSLELSGEVPLEVSSGGAIRCLI